MTKKDLNDMLDRIIKSVTPTTHCCECMNNEEHMVCIQYPNCTCESDERVSEANQGRSSAVEIMSEMYDDYEPKTMCRVKGRKVSEYDCANCHYDGPRCALEIDLQKEYEFDDLKGVVDIVSKVNYCIECGNTFVPPKDFPKQNICSQACFDAVDQESN